ncbi:MAG: hypothetical protein R3F20_12970 [Planctomycetota bacterium]
MIIRTSTEGRPGVVTWWIVYCFVGAALSLGVLALYFVGVFMAPRPSDDPRPVEIIISSSVQFASAVFLGVGPFLRRSRGTWTFGIIQFAISTLCSCFFCLPFSIPLFIYWIRPECRDWFSGRSERQMIEVFE